MISSSKAQIRLQRNNFDYWLISATAVLVIVGLLTIYDASVVAAARDFGDKLYYFKNQVIWVFLGLGALLFFSFFSYRKLLKASPAILFLSIILLIAVLIPQIGSEVYGARRWIVIAGFTFQPSEFAKLSLILYLSLIIAKFENLKFRLFDILIVFFLPALVVLGLIVLQPDLGTAIIIGATSMIIYFIGKAPIWHFAAVIPAFVLSAAAAIFTAPYRIERLKSFFDPSYDPQGASYHINQILSAISSGGLFGVGIGASRYKFAFIPEVQTDAIFAIFVEELGFVGALFLISVFLFLIAKAVTISKEAENFSGKILAAGIAGLIAVQSLFNIASNVALVPLTGIPLPFISHGGSSLVITMASVGILINIKRTQ